MLCYTHTVRIGHMPVFCNFQETCRVCVGGLEYVGAGIYVWVRRCVCARVYVHVCACVCVRVRVCLCVYVSIVFIYFCRLILRGFVLYV